MKRTFGALVLIGTILAGADGVGAQGIDGGTIVGRVLNSQNQQPIAIGTVRIGNTIIVNLSTADRGGFVLRNVPVGTQTLIVSCPGYNPLVEQLTVQRGQTIQAGDGGIVRLDPTYMKSPQRTPTAAPTSSPSAPS